MENKFFVYSTYFFVVNHIKYYLIIKRLLYKEYFNIILNLNSFSIHNILVNKVGF